MNDNNISIEVYSSGTTKIWDSSAELFQAQDLRFRSGFPGGLYLDASFFVPRDITMPWELRAGQRVVMRNGGKVVYEGYICGFDFMDSVSGQGILVNMQGAWAEKLMQWGLRKIWADTRVDETAWVWDNDESKAEIWKVDRNNRIIISCETATFLNSDDDDAYIVYTAPEGETIARITYDYVFNEYAGRSFKMFVQEWNGAVWATVTGSVIDASGSGSKDFAISSGITKLRLGMGSYAAQSVAADERNLAAWTKLCVYSETGTIDLPAVAGDVLTEMSSVLNSTTFYLQALASARSLVGTTSAPASFGAFDYESVANILNRAAKFGDGNNTRMAVGTRHSELAPSPDGKPVLFCETYPVLTDWDVSIRLDDPNVMNSVTIKQSFNRIANWITVRYVDDRDVVGYITPETDSGLKDDTSIATYGRKWAQIDLGYCNSTVAAQNGYRYLAAYKDPQFELSGPIQVMGTIRTRSGQFIPVSQVFAGLRIKLENWLNDLTGAGQGVTFLISSVGYNDADESISITAGPPPDLTFPAMIRPIDYGVIDLPEMVRVAPGSGGVSGGGGGGKGGKSKTSKTPSQKNTGSQPIPGVSWVNPKPTTGGGSKDKPT